MRIGSRFTSEDVTSEKMELKATAEVDGSYRGRRSLAGWPFAAGALRKCPRRQSYPLCDRPGWDSRL